MKYLLPFICILIALTHFNCKDDDDNTDPANKTDYTVLDVITGIDFYDDIGLPIGRWKSPNHKPGAIACYPIPNIGTVFISSQQVIERIWLIPADCQIDTVTMNIPSLSQDLNYTITELEAAQVKDMPISNFNNNLILDFSDVTPGFYKIFFLLDSGVLFWQNLYIDPTVNNIPSFQFLDDLCN